METWKDGKRITVREKFEGMGKGKGPEAVIEDDPGHISGTKITCRGTRFSKTGLDISALKKVLEWQVPCLPDFTVYVNRKPVSKRNLAASCIEYAFDEVIKDLGNVSGSIFYNKNDSEPLKATRIFIYVFGRSVGNPQGFYHLLPPSTVNRVVGMISADGLDDEISFDRGGFKQDSVKYHAVKKFISGVLESIIQDITYSKQKEPPRDKTDEIKEGIAIALKSAESELNKSLVNADGNINKNHPYRLELLLDEEIPWISRIDPKNNVIYINAYNPQLVVYSSKTNPTSALNVVFLTLAINALAEDQVGANNGNSDLFKRFAQTRMEVAKRLFSNFTPIGHYLKQQQGNDEQKAIAVSDVRLNPYRLYSIEDAAKLFGRDIDAVTRLYMAGTLRSCVKRRGIDRFRQEDILSCMSKIEGYIEIGSVSDILFPSDHESEGAAKHVLVNKIIDSRGNKPEYLKNVGSIAPLYFVKANNVEEFKRWYNGVE